VLRIDPRFCADFEARRVGRRAGIGAARAMFAQRGAPLRRGPEFVPPPQGPLVGQRLLVLYGHLTEPGAHIDVAPGAERLKIFFQTGILPERLNEGTNGVLNHRSHLFAQLGKFGRCETLIEPWTICFKIEVGIADQKIRRPEAAEWREPAPGIFQIPLERIDVW